MKLGLGLGINYQNGLRFTPKRISGLALWLDASDLATITKDGSNYVGAWADKSGNGRNMSQGTGINQPQWNTNNEIVFDGSNDKMNVAFTIAQPVTMYIVLKQITWTLDRIIMDGNSNSSLGMIQRPTASPNLSIYNNSVGTSVANTTFVLGEYAIAKGHWNGASSYFQKNNGTEATGTVGTAAAPLGFNLGSRGDGAANFANFAVKAVLIYTRNITGAEDTKIKNYLANKYGIAI